MKMCLLRHQLNRLFKLPPDKTELQSHFLLKGFISEFLHFELHILQYKNKKLTFFKRWGSSKLSAYSMAYSIYSAGSPPMRSYFLLGSFDTPQTISYLRLPFSLRSFRDPTNRTPACTFHNKQGTPKCNKKRAKLCTFFFKGSDNEAGKSSINSENIKSQKLWRMRWIVGVKGKSTAAYRLVREDTFVLLATP